MAKNKKERKILKLSPFFTILIMTLAIMIASFFLSLTGFEGQKAVVVSLPNGNLPYGIEMTLTTIKNAFSLDGLKFIINNVSNNLEMFRPLILLLIVLIGISIGEASGLFDRWFSKLRHVRIDILTFAILLLGIIVPFLGDSMFLLYVPLVAVIYKHAGRNPVLGVLTAFIGISIGYGTGIFVNYNGYLLGLKTQIAANLERNNNYTYNLGSTLFINAASTIILSIFGTFAIKNFLLPKLAKPICVYDEENYNNHGLLITNLFMLLAMFVFIYSVVPGLPFSGILLDISQDNYVAKLMSDNALFRQGFVYIITMIMMLASFIYGYINGQFKNSHDFNIGLSKGFEKLGHLFVMMFFALQMIALLEWTNIGEVLAAKLIDMLGVLQFSGLPLIFAFILVVFVISLLIPTAMTKWVMLAPIAIPLFMRSNITPDFTQFIFMAVDGIAKAFTPLCVYFLVMVGFVQKYSEDESITIFGTLHLIMPTILMMLGIWIMIILGWYIIGLPLGINTFPTI